jgi:hypothetical protein
MLDVFPHRVGIDACLETYLTIRLIHRGLTIIMTPLPVPRRAHLDHIAESRVLGFIGSALNVHCDGHRVHKSRADHGSPQCSSSMMQWVITDTV